MNNLSVQAGFARLKNLYSATASGMSPLFSFGPKNHEDLSHQGGQMMRICPIKSDRCPAERHSDPTAVHPCCRVPSAITVQLINQSFVHSFHPSIHSVMINPAIYPFIDLLIPSFHPSIDSFIHSFMYSIHRFINVSIHHSFHSFIHASIHSPVYSVSQLVSQSVSQSVRESVS